MNNQHIGVGIGGVLGLLSGLAFYDKNEKAKSLLLAALGAGSGATLGHLATSQPKPFFDKAKGGLKTLNQVGPNWSNNHSNLAMAIGAAPGVGKVIYQSFRRDLPNKDKTREVIKGLGLSVGGALGGKLLYDVNTSIRNTTDPLGTQTPNTLKNRLGIIIERRAG
jgi:hypothetical protein